MNHQRTLLAGARMPAAITGGVYANLDPAAVLRDLSAAMGEFRTRQEAEVAELRAAVDDQARQIGALRLGGIAPGASAAAPSRAAIAALGSFAKTGNLEALQQLSPQASMTSDSGPDGGFLVPDQVGTEILRLQLNLSPLRGLAKIVPTRTKDYVQPFSVGGTASGWVAERQARPQTANSQIDLLEVPAGEIYANPACTQALLDDSDFDIGAFVLEEISREFSVKEGAAFATGDGMDKPRGFLSYPTFIGAGNAKFGQIEAIKSGSAGGLAADPDGGDAIQDVLHALKAGHRKNATWLMNSKTQSVVSKLKDSQGRYIWTTSVAAGVPDTLLGRPVALDENMPDIAANAFPIALGDWQQGYIINDRLGTRILRDPYSNKPFVMFYATKRVGGRVINSEAIKLLKIAA